MGPLLSKKGRHARGANARWGETPGGARRPVGRDAPGATPQPYTYIYIYIFNLSNLTPWPHLIISGHISGVSPHGAYRPTGRLAPRFQGPQAYKNWRFSLFWGPGTKEIIDFYKGWARSFLKLAIFFVPGAGNKGNH